MVKEMVEFANPNKYQTRRIEIAELLFAVCVAAWIIRSIESIVAKGVKVAFLILFLISTIL